VETKPGLPRKWAFPGKHWHERWSDTGYKIEIGK
jgi:hypothetical protein